MEINIDWEVIYHLRIVSLNTTWKLNLSQIYRLPLLQKIFKYEGFRDDSYMEESILSKELTAFKYFENTDLKKKEYFMIIENIFDEDPKLTPEVLNLLKDINWIFDIPEKAWILGQHQIYQILNPEYKFEFNTAIYQCVNCKIKVTKDLLNLKQECKFHGELIKAEKSYGSVLCCTSCGLESVNLSFITKCHTLPKHCFVIIKN
jgi:hypothetical protein